MAIQIKIYYWPNANERFGHVSAQILEIDNNSTTSDNNFYISYLGSTFENDKKIYGDPKVKILNLSDSNFEIFWDHYVQSDYYSDVELDEIIQNLTVDLVEASEIFNLEDYKKFLLNKDYEKLFSDKEIQLKRKLINNEKNVCQVFFDTLITHKITLYRLSIYLDKLSSEQKQKPFHNLYNNSAHAIQYILNVTNATNLGAQRVLFPIDVFVEEKPIIEKIKEKLNEIKNEHQNISQAVNEINSLLDENYIKAIEKTYQLYKKANLTEQIKEVLWTILKSNPPQIMHQVKINCAIQIIADKAEDLRQRNFIEAADCADQLVKDLSVKVDAYFILHPKAQIESSIEFQQKCTKLIEDAEKNLAKHRGWKHILANIALAIAGLGIGYVIAGTVYKSKKGHWFFQQTDTKKKLDLVKDKLIFIF